VRVARSLLRYAWVTILGGVALAGISTGPIRVIGLGLWGLGLIGLVVTSTYIFKTSHSRTPSDAKTAAAHV